jgi:hypothetical protein
VEGSYKKSRNCRSEGGHSFTVHYSDCSIYQSSQVGKHLVHGGERLIKKKVVIHRDLRMFWFVFYYVLQQVDGNPFFCINLYFNDI